MAAKQEITKEEAEGAVTVSTWARAPSAGVALQNPSLQERLLALKKQQSRRVGEQRQNRGWDRGPGPCKGSGPGSWSSGRQWNTGGPGMWSSGRQWNPEGPRPWSGGKQLNTGAEVNHVRSCGAWSHGGAGRAGSHGRAGRAGSPDGAGDQHSRVNRSKDPHNGTDESEDLHSEADDHHSRAEESRNPHSRAESLWTMERVRRWTGGSAAGSATTGGTGVDSWSDEA
ncbi:hypothetical protein M9458_041318, partial [Cirrhinus mrigala]